MQRKIITIISVIICLSLLGTATVFASAKEMDSTTTSVTQNETVTKAAKKSNKIKVAFFDAKSYDEAAFVSSNAKYGYEINFIDEKLTPDSVSLAENSDFVCVFVNDTVNETVIKRLKRYGVQGIILRCAGYDNVDLAAAAAAGIPVLNVPSYSPNAVAEHTVALLLSLTRHIPEAVSRTQQLNFDLTGLEGRNLNELTIGIIGAGRIGKITAEIMSGFGMRVIINDRHPDENWAASKGYEFVDQKTLFQESDVICLHCSLNESTYHIINEESLSLMKSDAVLINTGRGALVDTKALIGALENNEIGGAALDVYENEGDYFFRDCSEEDVTDETLKKLLSFSNVIVTGHQAFLTDTALANIADMALSNIEAVQNGLDLKNALYN